MDCVICDKGIAAFFAQKTFSGGGKGSAYRCTSCGHEHCTLEPSFSNNRVKESYLSLDYFHKDKGHQGIDSIDASSTAAVEWATHRFNVLSEIVLSSFESARVVELGCLEGFLVSFLISRGYNAVGYDINAEVISRSLSINKIPLHVLDIERVPLPEKNVDLIVSFHTVEHLADLHQATKNLLGSLSPKGHFFIEVPSSPKEIFNPDHFHNFSEQSLKLYAEVYFRKSAISINSYTDAQGFKHQSLYCHAWERR
jgi:SAM-dependent methyltransferase